MFEAEIIEFAKQYKAGESAFSNRNYSKAIEYFSAGFKIYSPLLQAEGFPLSEKNKFCDVATKLGHCCSFQESWSAAKNYYQQAKIFFEKNNNDEGYTDKISTLDFYLERINKLILIRSRANTALEVKEESCPNLPELRTKTRLLSSTDSAKVITPGTQQTRPKLPVLLLVRQKKLPPPKKLEIKRKVNLEVPLAETTVPKIDSGLTVLQEQLEYYRANRARLSFT